MICLHLRSSAATVASSRRLSCSYLRAPLSESGYVLCETRTPRSIPAGDKRVPMCSFKPML